MKKVSRVMLTNKSRTSDIDMRDAFFDELYKIAKRDSNVMFLTADMGAFSLSRFKEDLHSQYINVGVAEQNLVSVAAGLTLGGRKVFIYAIAPFVTQRCYEQIKIDLSCMSLPVTIIGIGAGIAYGSDGPTHHATQDIAIIRALPEMTILSPSDSVMAAAAAQLAYKSSGPVYVRIDKGKFSSLYSGEDDFSDGLALLEEGRDIVIIATGVMVHHAFKVAKELARCSISTGVVDLYRLKPVNRSLLLSIVAESNRIVTLEEHSIVGGIGSIVSDILVDAGISLPVKRIAIADRNCAGYGDRDWMYSHYGLDLNSVTEAILNWKQADVGNAGRKFLSGGGSIHSELALKDFADLLGTTVDAIPDDCRGLISEVDFHYRTLSGDERDRIILRVFKTINSDSLTTAGPHRKSVWEKGWSENLQEFVDGNLDLKELIPKFIKRDEVIRLKGNYIMPTNLDFETCFVKVLRVYLFRKYFRDAVKVYEVGCGTGLNLVELAKLFPEKKLYGLDWSDASCKIVDKLAKTQNLNLAGLLFDMFSPDYQLDIDNDSAVFTIGAMEQLGKNFEPFLQFLLSKKPSICINIETIYELYDQHSLFDYCAAKYLEKREYLQGYLPRLRQLEIEDKIEILKVQRTFGSLYHDGYTYIVWKPKA